MCFLGLACKKKSDRCVVPKDRYNVDTFDSLNGGYGSVATRYGHFLEHVNLKHVDTSFFSMNRAEAEQLDLQQRLLLEVVWECMENAGQVGWQGKNIGCYVGVFGEDWLDMMAKDIQVSGIYRVSDSGDFAIANGVSYEYSLKGPRYVCFTLNPAFWGYAETAWRFVRAVLRPWLDCMKLVRLYTAESVTLLSWPEPISSLRRP